MVIYDTIAMYNKDEITMTMNGTDTNNGAVSSSSYGIIYRPAGWALTSCPTAHPGTSLLRFGTLDVMANMAAFILNDKTTWDNNKSTFFDARYVYEAGCFNLHLGNCQNCALGRDVITNDAVYACKQSNIPTKSLLGTISKNNNRAAKAAATASTSTTTATVSTALVTTNNKHINNNKINEKYQNKIS